MDEGWSKQRGATGAFLVAAAAAGAVAGGQDIAQQACTHRTAGCMRPAVNAAVGMLVGAHGAGAAQCCSRKRFAPRPAEDMQGPWVNGPSCQELCSVAYCSEKRLDVAS